MGNKNDPLLNVLVIGGEKEIINQIFINSISNTDLYEIRTAKQKLIMRQNDLKNLMEKIEIKTSKYFEEIQIIKKKKKK